MVSSWEKEYPSNFLMAYMPNIAKHLYSDIPYHNFQHALDTVEEARRLAQHCEDNGLSVNKIVVDGAALFHDAGFADEFYPKDQYKSKEEWAAYLAVENFRFIDLDESEIKQIEHAILATQLGVAPRTIEAKIVRRADLANIAGDYENFALCSLRLLAENQQMRKAPENYARWIGGTDKILSGYLEDDVSFGEFDLNPEGENVFTAAAKANIARIRQETPEGFLRIIKEKHEQLGRIALEIFS